MVRPPRPPLAQCGSGRLCGGQSSVLCTGILVATLQAVVASTASGSVPQESQQVAEACITDLAMREGKSKAEVLAALASVASGGASEWTSACDIASATASPVGIYMSSFGTFLHEAGDGFQLLVAFMGIGAGAACAWDGPAIWRALFTATAFVAAALVTHHEANLWGICPNIASDLVLMATAGASVALAVHVGFEGAQVLFGVLLGLVAAYGFGGWARTLENSIPGVALLWYEVGAVAGFLMYTVWRKAVLSTLSPMLGGYLATVGAGFMLARFYAAVAGTASDGSAASLAMLPRGDAPWVSAAGTILGAGGEHALPIHLACAMLASFVQGSWDKRWLSVATLLSSLFVTALSSATGFLCPAFGDSESCPVYLAKTEDCGWPVFGFVVWASITGAAAWRQLGCLRDWEAKNFWRSELETMMYVGQRPLAQPYPPEHFDYERQPIIRTGNNQLASRGNQDTDFRDWAAEPQPRGFEDELGQRLDAWWESVAYPKGRAGGRGQRRDASQQPPSGSSGGGLW